MGIHKSILCNLPKKHNISSVTQFNLYRTSRVTDLNSIVVYTYDLCVIHTRGIRLLNLNIPLWKQQRKRKHETALAFFYWPRRWNFGQRNEYRNETENKRNGKMEWIKNKRERNRTDYTSLLTLATIVFIFMSQIDRKTFFLLYFRLYLLLKCVFHKLFWVVFG